MTTQGIPVSEKLWTYRPNSDSVNGVDVTGENLTNDENIPFYKSGFLFKFSYLGNGDRFFIYLTQDRNYPKYVSREVTIDKVTYKFNVITIPKITIIISAVVSVLLNNGTYFLHNMNRSLGGKIINIPNITISSQTLIGASDIGNTIFTIEDIISYYEASKCKNYTSYLIERDQIKITIFEFCEVLITPVIKGKGKDMLYKTSDIFNKLGRDNIGVDFGIFRLNMILYALLKYILAKILYGEFSIIYLLNEHNTKFLNDLQYSRFNKALYVFQDENSPLHGYNKYFK